MFNRDDNNEVVLICSEAATLAKEAKEAPKEALIQKNSSNSHLMITRRKASRMPDFKLDHNIVDQVNPPKKVKRKQRNVKAALPKEMINLHDSIGTLSNAFMQDLSKQLDLSTQRIDQDLHAKAELPKEMISLHDSIGTLSKAIMLDLSTQRDEQDYKLIPSLIDLKKETTARVAVVGKEESMVFGKSISGQELLGIEGLLFSSKVETTELTDLFAKNEYEETDDIEQQLDFTSLLGQVTSAVEMTQRQDAVQFSSRSLRSQTPSLEDLSSADESLPNSSDMSTSADEKSISAGSDMKPNGLTRSHLGFFESVVRTQKTGDGNCVDVVSFEPPSKRQKITD